MANMSLANFDQKQPQEQALKPEAQAPLEVQAAAPAAADPALMEKSLTEKIKSGEAVKTSLYLAPDMHKALKFMALEMSYLTDDEGKKHARVSTNDLIVLAIEDYLRSATET